MLDTIALYVVGLPRAPSVGDGKMKNNDPSEDRCIDYENTNHRLLRRWDLLTPPQVCEVV
jgi:hypothetical protein